MTTLQLTKWDLQLQANSVANRTSDFISNTLIVRRGQSFNITLTLNRTPQSSENLSLTAVTGPAPSESLNTKAVMPVSTAGSTSTWSASSRSTSSNTRAVTINIPVNVPIGRYQLSLQITSGGRTTSKPLGAFIVLFNPWASGDDVFMSNEAQRNEYVLNQTGVIFYGSADYRGSRVWDYGQFEDDILNITLTILDSSIEYKRDKGNEVSQRKSPIHVGRVLSAMINSNDDNGILVGNWSGDYSGGVSPTQWSSSVAVLRRWKSSGPVKFGQCWVYAGVLCTVLRCLGIPCRVITNFESAHDTNENLSVDQYYNQRGESIYSSDSVWNFHAWTEGWFARSDLSSIYNGWQILDATPQETSEGLYRVGPTSQKAIKEGDIDLLYDGPFVIAEVNADKITWVRNSDGSTRLIYSETSSVGKFISTKAIGSFQREDVTNQYKYQEGTAKEREIYEKAKSKVTRSMTASAFSARESRIASRLAAPAPKPVISGTFKQSGEQQVGEDFTVTLALKNDVAEETCVKVNITTTAIVYTGAPVKEILHEAQSVTLGPNEEKNIPIAVTYEQYKNAITTDNMIQFVAVCVDGKGGELLVETVKVLKNPPLLLKVSGKPIINKPLTVDIIFSNPIGENVQDSQLTVEGSGMIKESLIINVPLMKPNQRSLTQFELTPYRKGKLCLLVDFSSKEFTGVKAYQQIEVSSA